MRLIRTIAAVCVATSVLAACGGNDLGTELGLSHPQARFINAMPAGPTLDYYRNAQLNTENIAYKGVTRYQNIDDGTQTVSYNLGGTPISVASQSFSAANGHHYTAIAVPSASSPLAIIDDIYDKGLLSDKARVRGFNASFNAQNVDIYIVPPGTDITSQAPIFPAMSYLNATPPSGQDSAYLSGGLYQAIVTAPGDKVPLLTTAPFNLSDNADWLLITIPANGVSEATPNNIHILVAQGNDADTSAQELGPQ